MKEEKYKKILQDLKSDFHILMSSYLQKLHESIHEDFGKSLSHVDIAKKIKKDCLSIFSNKLESIAFDERSEGEVINEILEYNYDMTDIEHIKEVEGIDLYPFLNWLDENCIRRTGSQWIQFGIHELIANGKANPGTIGSKRTQFCRYCGEEIYVSMNDNSHALKHTK